MTRALLAATTAIALLAGCRDTPEDDDQSNAVNMARTAPEDGNAVDPTGAQAIPAAAVTAEQARTIMHDRHENYEKFGDSMKVISRELKSATPNLAAVRQNAATYTKLGPQLLSWFPPGSGPAAGKTDAKAEIWQKPEDFAAKARAFNQAATAFQAAAQGSDVAAIRAAQANLGKSCKACHDLYRAPD